MNNLGGSLEEQIMASLIWSKKSGHVVRMALDPALLSGHIYRKIARKAFEYYDTYSSPPGDHIADLLEPDVKDDSEYRLLSSVLTHLRDMQDTQNPDFVLDRLSLFMESRKMRLSLQEAQDALDMGLLEEAKALLLSASSQPGFNVGIDLSDSEKSLSFLDKSKSKTVRLGIETLDKHGMSPSPGQMFLTMAGTGKGKTWALIHYGKTALMDGLCVFHLSLEMTEEETVERYVQSLFSCVSSRGKPDDELYQEVSVPFFTLSPDGGVQSVETFNRSAMILQSENISEIREKIDLLKGRPPLYVKSFPAGSLTFSQMKAWLDTMQQMHGLSPDVLIIDYPDRMRFQHTNDSSRRIEFGDLYASLKGLAIERKFVLHVATQANREGMRSDVIREYHAANDLGKIREADFVLSYSQTDEEAQIGYARLFSVKSRFGRAGFQTAVLQHYTTGQFCLECLGGSGEEENNIRLPQNASYTDNSEPSERTIRGRRKNTKRK